MSNNIYVISSVAVAPEQKGGKILYHHHMATLGNKSCEYE